MHKIIVILGPTGAGKTEIALELAKRFNGTGPAGGEIINADSRQFYRDLVIGTAQPPENFFMEVPHHLFGVSSLDDIWDAARFEKEADRLIDAVSVRNHLPLIVGGTGLYLRALLYGLFSGPPAKQSIRNRLEKRIDAEGTKPLYEELKTIDPQAAITIHPNDPIRIIRALEVYELTGKPISIHQKGHEFKKVKYRCLKLGIQWDRAELYNRINQRVDRMIQNGLEEEVADLRKKQGDHPILLRSIGYEEWFPYFDGKRSREETIDMIKQNSRNLAKRQLTWFRPEKDIVWFKAGDLAGMEKRIQAHILC